jgi:hypothetical protein
MVYNCCYGEVSEWLIEPVSKTGVPLAGTAGSNPALSVFIATRRPIVFFMPNQPSSKQSQLFTPSDKFFSRSIIASQSENTS